MKINIFLLVLTGIIMSANLTAQESLGLAERRAIKTYQEQQWPAQEKALKEAVGFAIELQIDWEKMAEPGKADAYTQDFYWSKAIFNPLTTALKQITVDAIGKDALKAKLKKIVITFNADTAPASNYANGVALESGVLTVNLRPGANADDEKEKADAIQKAIEAKL